jgi:hypothetical protein
MAKGTTSVEPAGRAEKAAAARVKARQWMGLFEVVEVGMLRVALEVWENSRGAPYAEGEERAVLS